MKRLESVIILPSRRLSDLKLGDRLPERLKRKLEGLHPWGYEEVSSQGRGLWVRERLTVFPPGTTAAERRAITIFRNWPVVGSIVALCAMIGLGLVLTPVAAFLLAFALYGASVGLGARATHRVRNSSVQLIVVRAIVDEGVSTWGNLGSMVAARAAFEQLDERAIREGLTPAQYEAHWARIFQSLDEGRDARADELEAGIVRAERRPGI